MSAKRFREIALKMEGAIEGAHHGHADFRVGGRVFATLGHPDRQWGMVKLTVEQQAMVVEAEPSIFRPVPGGWGKGGSTNVNLAAADPATLRSALAMAWENARSKTPTARARVRKTAPKPPAVRRPGKKSA